MADPDSLPLPTLDSFGEAELLDLEDRVAHVLRMRSRMVDGEKHTLREVGEELGITEERVRQIEGQGLLLIRQMREVQRHLRSEPSLRAMYRWWTPKGSRRSGRRGR
ncbi:MAG: sigma factor-like helix-turn-helix DNA-binding protein [Solirubrobacterales bacterium]